MARRTVTVVVVVVVDIIAAVAGRERRRDTGDRRNALTCVAEPSNRTSVATETTMHNHATKDGCIIVRTDTESRVRRATATTGGVIPFIVIVIVIALILFNIELCYKRK